MKKLLILCFSLMSLSLQAQAQPIYKRTTRAGDITSTDSVSIPLKGMRPYLNPQGRVRYINAAGVRMSAAEALGLTVLTGGVGSGTTVAPTTFGQITGSLPANRVSGLSLVATSNSFPDLGNRPAEYPSSVSMVTGNWPATRLSNLSSVNISVFNNDAGYQTSNQVTQAITNGTAGLVTTTTYNTNRTFDQNSIAAAQNTANAAVPTTTYNTNRTNDQNVVASKAPVASPAFTGTPTAPTASTGTSSGQIATTQFVQQEIARQPSGGGGPPSGAAGGDFTGTYPNPTLIAKGPGAGTYGGGTNVVQAITVDGQGRTINVSTGPAPTPTTVPPHTHPTSQITGFAADVNTQVENYLKSLSGYANGRVLSSANGALVWVAPTTSGTATGGGSTTGTTGSTALAPYDSVLARIDTTLGRIQVGLMTVDSVRTAAELRSRITTAQTNKDIVLVDNFVDDNGEYTATGAFTNVRIRSARPTKIVTLKSTNSYKWNWNGSATRTRVEIADLIIRTTATTGSAAIYNSYEQVPWDGYCMRNVRIVGTGQGSYNGLNYQQASTVSGTGAEAKNIYFVNVKVDSIPRSNEFLCQVYNVDRVKNFVVAYSRFSNQGLNTAEFGANLSFSGRFAGVMVYRSKFTEGNGPQLEMVNGSNAILMENTITSTTRDGVGVGISDDGRLLTKNIFLINNYVNVSSRPYYDHGTVGTTIRGGLYIGRAGVEIKAKQALYENHEIRLYDKSANGVAFIDDPSASGNTYRNLKITSQNSRLFGAVSVKEPMILKGSNHTVTSVTTVIGQQVNGTYYSTGAILNQGTNNTVTGNVFSTAADTATYVPPVVTAGTSNTNVVLLIDGNNQPNGAVVINDRSTYNHQTTSRGSMQVVTSEKFYGTGSLFFNGTSNFLEIAGSAKTLLGTADYTMEFYVKLITLPSGTVAGLLSKSTTDNKIIWTTGWPGTNAGIALSVKDAAGNDVTSGPSISSGISWGLGVWHHIAFIRTGGVTRVYKGGQYLGSSTANPSLEVSGNVGPLMLGARNYGGCCLFNGYMHHRTTLGNYYNVTGSANFTPDASF